MFAKNGLRSRHHLDLQQGKRKKERRKERREELTGLNEVEIISRLQGSEMSEVIRDFPLLAAVVPQFSLPRYGKDGKWRGKAEKTHAQGKEETVQCSKFITRTTR